MAIETNYFGHADRGMHRQIFQMSKWSQKTLNLCNLQKMNYPLNYSFKKFENAVEATKPNYCATDGKEKIENFSHKLSALLPKNM